MNRERHLLRWSWVIVCGSLAGCATKSKESESAATPVTATVGVAASQAFPTVPQSPPAAAREDDSAVVDSNSAAAASEARRESAAAPSMAQKPGGAASLGKSRGAPLAPAPAPAKAARKESAWESEDASRAFAEPPELRAALLEFEQQFERLSSTKACDDACRAYDSMRRSAQRICDLVIDADPRERCRTAKARLEQASRDLSERCTSCR